MTVEFLALANHRSEVRAAIGECAERARRTLTQVVEANLPDGRMFAMASGSAAAFMLLHAAPDCDGGAGRRRPRPFGSDGCGLQTPRAGGRSTENLRVICATAVCYTVA
ncbi:MAG: hypothetical protein ACLQIK_13765 [Mycobacterium sp.]|uniref:hypothetical protein n=1 Tax=Mycobacterium sp. TaxID=1785 RepID=UPI003F96D3B0